MFAGSPFIMYLNQQCTKQVTALDLSHIASLSFSITMRWCVPRLLEFILDENPCKRIVSSPDQSACNTIRR
jgi:hypothetical protein